MLPIDVSHISKHRSPLCLNSYLSSGTSPIVAVKSTGRMMIIISQQRYQPSDNNKNVDV
jgi:hypothetical protein